ncbi:MAG: DNA primase [Parcubacteria group bacterium Licking1014_17]|nr:MAG: DNA primase [Parcubacteria group bacterium Licking1014_17]
MEDNISKIKDRVDIVELIGGYVKLQKAGINYKARCPFHNEKTGSFFVSPERQIWHCFGCGLGGDIFGFIRQIEGVEFPEALRILAARAGVELEPVRPEFQNLKSRLYEICELSAKFFEKQLHESATGKRALEYLYGRGLTGESIEKFRLGFAPDSWRSLKDFLGRKFNSNEIRDAGLSVRRENSGEDYDRFRSRIMFPIFDLNSQVVGFAGRVFETGSKDTAAGETPAKYVNSPQTPIYDKGRILYGLNHAKMAIRQKGRCVVVEGNMDVIMSHQAGADNSVASSGTAFTDGQLRLIKRYTDNLDLCFDADSAGAIALERGVDLALSHGLNVGVIPIDEEGIKDPADYVRKYGDRWTEIASKSVPFMAYFFDLSKKVFDTSTALGKKLFAQKILPLVASIANKIEQSHWVAEAALALKVKDDFIYSELANVKARRSYTPEEAKGEAVTAHEVTGALSPAEEDLISLLIKEPCLAGSIPESAIPFLSSTFKSIAEHLKIMAGDESVKKDRPDWAVKTLTGNPVFSPISMNIEVAYLKSDELWKDRNIEHLEEEFKNILCHIKRKGIMAKLGSLEYDIKGAEKACDKTSLAKLLAEFSSLTKELVQ